MFQKSLLSLSKNLRTSLKNKISVIKVKFSKRNLSILCVLLKEGLIRGYFLKDNYFIYVLLKHIDNINALSLKPIFSLTERKYHSTKSIKTKFMCFNGCVFSTKKGVLSHKDILKYKLGGFPLINFL